ncbi:MAG: prepilin-type N-terminal cleavage/methylation domain-containing protein [Candidatus Omnitrophica bacterium]|nr:prepilin-type N-terminal cleavage/methylation domain-containing protein [Candidatus Omnitrophota bacterium]
MMSKTGNRQACLKSKKGFTLLEAMVTVAVLSFGIVLIYEALFISLDALNYCSSYFTVSAWMSEKISQAQNTLTYLGTLPDLDTSGDFADKNGSFSWRLSYGPIGEEEGLYQINIDVSQHKTKRALKLSRVSYALFKEEE